jgi:hypothetical protein
MSARMTFSENPSLETTILVFAFEPDVEPLSEFDEEHPARTSEADAMRTPAATMPLLDRDMTNYLP